MAVVTFGYVNAQGINDAAVVSPTDDLTGTALDDLVHSAYEATGETALWVDGSPQSLVDAVAARLGLPVGKPDGWDPVPVEDGVAPPSRAERRATARAAKKAKAHKHHFRPAKAAERGPLRGVKIEGGGRVFVCSCGAMQVRGGN